MRRPAVPRLLVAGSLALAFLAPAAAPAVAADPACSRYAATTGSDTAAGTDAAPFKTVQRLADALLPGETGCLRQGVYTETANGFAVKFKKAGLTLRSHPGERARVVGIVYVPAIAAGTRIASLDVEGDGTMNTIKIYAADVVVEDSDITNHNRGESCMMLGSNSGAGAAIRPIVRRNVFHDCGSPVNTNHDHGIYASNVEGGEIVDNVFANPSAYAIQFYPNSRNLRFAHNVVDGGSSIRGGIVFGGDDFYASSGNVVEQNVITYAATYAITSTWHALVGTGNVARRNCVHGARYGATGGEGGYSATETVSADPLFVDRARRDYRLRTGSPCLAVVGYDTVAKLSGVAAPLETAPQPAPEPVVAPEPVATPEPEPEPAAPVADPVEAPAPETAVNLAPTVRLLAPLAGSVFRRELTMTAAAEDDRRVVLVEFYVDGVRRGSDSTAPYSTTWKTRTRMPGSHTVVARAYDEQGLSTTASTTVFSR